MRKPDTVVSRRSMLRAACLAPWLPIALGGCAAALRSPLTDDATPAAQALLRKSVEAHGLSGFRALRDINVSYAGHWSTLAGRMQPALTDTDFRASSEERLLLDQRLLAQAHVGIGGRKQVLRRPGGAPGRNGSAQGDVQVWYNGEEALDEERRAATALAADAMPLALLGPLALVGRDLPMDVGDTEFVLGRPCQVLHIRLAPGLGFSPADQFALCIDREDALVRRLRYSLSGLPKPANLVAEIDTLEHVKRHGVMWPTRFEQRFMRPIPLLPVHAWRVTGLDVNRGYGVLELAGPHFAGTAVAPAAMLPPAAA